MKSANTELVTLVPALAGKSVTSSIGGAAVRSAHGQLVTPFPPLTGRSVTSSIGAGGAA
ncbi:MAG: hypothetical protein QOG43_463 [Actinomycetota bacterium]|jgi:hypothetical protein|nr:hypothetical protein [Actinomycetota bacterium]